MQKRGHFNIRIYGLLFDESLTYLLITDEFRLNRFMTKFPGGGLEFGEGTIDCLKRECKEELGQQPENLSHFYTTDFYQPTSYLDQQQQLISIYYQGILRQPYQFHTTDTVMDIAAKDGAQSFRWVPPLDIEASSLSMPVDKIVLEKLQQKLK
ncbi:MAG: NUDIX domain-containing protein [Bacteroidales bacterium]